VCQHPRAAEINAALASGDAVLRVQRRFGFARRDPLDRHVKSGHVPPAAPSPSQPSSAGGTPVEQVRAIVDSLNAIDVSRLSPSAQIALFAERRRAAESLARVGGGEKSGPMTLTPDEFKQVVISGWDVTVGDFLDALFNATTKHPEVLGAMREDLVSRGVTDLVLPEERR